MTQDYKLRRHNQLIESEPSPETATRRFNIWPNVLVGMLGLVAGAAITHFYHQDSSQAKIKVAVAETKPVVEESSITEVVVKLPGQG